MPVSTLCALAVGCAACVTDIRSRRIPNALTFGAAGAAWCFTQPAPAGAGFCCAVAGWFVGALIMFVPFALRGLGGGDVKLIAALGAWLGPANAMWLGLYAGVAGFVMALVVAACTRISADGVLQHLVFAPALDGERHPPAGRRFARRAAAVRVSRTRCRFCGTGDGDMAALNRMLKRLGRTRAAPN